MHLDHATRSKSLTKLDMNSNRIPIKSVAINHLSLDSELPRKELNVVKKQ